MTQERLQEIINLQTKIINYVNIHTTTFASEDIRLLKDAALAIHDLLEKTDV